MTHVIASNYLPGGSIRCCGNKCSLIAGFRALPIPGLVYRVLGIKPGPKVYQLASFGTKGEISVRDLSVRLAGTPFCRGITNWTFGFHFRCSQFASRSKDISLSGRQPLQTTKTRQPHAFDARLRGNCLPSAVSHKSLSSSSWPSEYIFSPSIMRPFSTILA